MAPVGLSTDQGNSGWNAPTDAVVARATLAVGTVYEIEGIGRRVYVGEATDGMYRFDPEFGDDLPSLLLRTEMLDMIATVTTTESTAMVSMSTIGLDNQTNDGTAPLEHEVERLKKYSNILRMCLSYYEDDILGAAIDVAYHDLGLTEANVCEIFNGTITENSDYTVI